MVLSTLHCNDAPSAIPRLLDMEVDPFLLSTSLIGVMSQRLLRKICPACGEAYEPSPEELSLFASYGAPLPTRLMRAGGCPECHQTGYSGRWAIHEILPIVPSVGRLIAARESIDAICEAGMDVGYVPMQIPALAAVIMGETTLEEAQRVVFLDPTYAEIQNAAQSSRAA
jgi:type IV pilus assembly protein PilB